MNRLFHVRAAGLILVFVLCGSCGSEKRNESRQTPVDKRKHGMLIPVARKECPTGTYQIEHQPQKYWELFTGSYWRQQLKGAGIIHQRGKFYLAGFEKGLNRNRELFFRLELTGNDHMLWLDTSKQNVLLVSYCESASCRMKALPEGGVGPCFKLKEDEQLDKMDRCIKTTLRIDL